MEDKETPRMRKYGESKTTRIMMATVPHVTAWAGGTKYQADGFLFDRVYIDGCNWRSYNMYVVSHCTNKNSYMSDSGTYERYPLGLKLLHMLCTVTGQNKDSN